ncbi:MAG: hypothetical protein WCT29_00940 [Candidatus Paceibacterota bacterium]
MREDAPKTERDPFTIKFKKMDIFISGIFTFIILKGYTRGTSQEQTKTDVQHLHKEWVKLKSFFSSGQINQQVVVAEALRIFKQLVVISQMCGATKEELEPKNIEFYDILGKLDMRSIRNEKPITEH